MELWDVVISKLGREPTCKVHKKHIYIYIVWAYGEMPAYRRLQACGGKILGSGCRV